MCMLAADDRVVLPYVRWVLRETAGEVRGSHDKQETAGEVISWLPSPRSAGDGADDRSCHGGAGDKIIFLAKAVE